MSEEKQNIEGLKASSAKADRKDMRFLVRFLVKTAVIAAVITVVFTFVFGVEIYHGNEMHPSLKDGDLVITYKLGKYGLGDIVRYKDPQTGNSRCSRIVGLPGFCLDITELGELKTNGYVPNEEVYYKTEQHEDSDVDFPYTVSEGSYFLLDDYRTIGHDSRDFGEIKDLDGKVVYIVRRRGF